MIRTSAFSDQPGEVVKLYLDRDDAKLLVKEMEDLAQAFPAHVLEGTAPFAQVYRELKRALEAG